MQRALDEREESSATAFSVTTGADAAAAMRVRRERVDVRTPCEHAAGAARE